MSRKVQVVILCEDTQHESFLLRFLERMGWPRRGMRVEKAPPGEGSAEQFIRKRFPLELEAHRSRPVRQALVVMWDGDNQGLAARLRTLDQACTDHQINPRAANERVAVFVPTWNLESWLAYLDGETIDEGRSNYPRLSRPRECRQQVEVLAEMCDRNKLRNPAPDSLERACLEYGTRLRPN